jgi:Na+/proline symporter
VAKHVEVAGDIVAAGSAAAGLILVYVGALSTGYSTFTAQERRSVKRSYRTRAWFALAGLVLFLISVALGLIGKWYDSDWEIPRS